MKIKNNKKGFTLIELLAVIIILAVIALIATPIVLNVVDNARKQANKNSAYGLLDGAKLYYMESLLDSSKQGNINGKTNLIDEIKVSGNKPANEKGYVYINKSGETAIAVVYDNVCYKKNFNENEITESSDVDNCTINTVETPQVSYKCRRATTLHTEKCTQTSPNEYCSGAGYTASASKGTTTITYGNLGTTGTLASGDAFDCDVNGDGVYDAKTERFYYVSDLYNTTTNAFDNNYAVLVYYNNTTLGVADNTSSSLTVYDSSNENWHGPVTAKTNLPTTSQWNNVSLASTTRAILTETGTTETTGGTLPTSYSYSGYAARLLIAQEINSACGITVGSLTTGELDTCNYLMENTKYSTSPKGTYGYWLETPRASYSSYVWRVSGSTRYVSYSSASSSGGFCGVRPAIEVLKSDISY